MSGKRFVLAAMLTACWGCAGLPRPTAVSADRPWAQAGEDRSQEAFLLGAEIFERHSLPHGVTDAQQVTLRLGQHTEKAVFKQVHEAHPRPITGQRPEGGLYFADRWEFEVAAYRLDRLIGLGMVPPTVIKSIHGSEGSLQLWIPDCFSERDRVERHLDVPDHHGFKQAIARMLVFDALIYNTDRNQGNILISRKDGKVWLIDHSRAFRLDRALPPSVKKHRLKLSPALRRGLESLTVENLTGGVGGLLTREQIKAVIARRDRILRSAP